MDTINRVFLGVAFFLGALVDVFYLDDVSPEAVTASDETASDETATGNVIKLAMTCARMIIFFKLVMNFMMIAIRCGD